MSAPRLRSPAGFLPLAAVDAALIVGSFVTAAGFTQLDPYLFFYDEGGTSLLTPLLIVMIIAIYLAGLYERSPSQSRIHRAQQLSLVAGLALLFEAFLSWINPASILPRSLATAGILIAIVVLFVWRTLLDAVLRRFSGPRTVLMLGGGPAMRDLAEHIQMHPEVSLSVLGCLTSDPASAPVPVLGAPADLWPVVREVKPNLIIAGTNNNRDEFPIRDLLDLRYSGITIEEAGAAFEMICHRVSLRELRPSRILFTADFEPQAGSVLIALADIIIAALLVIAGAPFAMFWALLIAASGRRPILRKTCAGFRGVPFTSRRLNIPEGRFLSPVALALHLDCYPDLWNVLAGRMSMVGPRPIGVALDRELTRTIPVYEYRQNAKPGLASWAQLHSEARLPVSDALREIEYDLYYVRHQSATLYAFVLLHGLRQTPA